MFTIKRRKSQSKITARTLKPRHEEFTHHHKGYNCAVFWIDIYNASFSVIWNVTHEQTDEHIKLFTTTHQSSRGRNWTMRIHEIDCDDGTVTYLLAIKKWNKDFGLLSHECLHLANMILDRRGVLPSFENDEPQTYLLQYIMNKCERVLK